MSSAHHLEYATRERRKGSLRSWLPIVASALILTAMSSSVGVYETEWRVDAVTGSSLFTRRVCGIQTSRTVQKSALQLRLEAAQIAWTPEWDHCSTQERNAFGGFVSRACGGAPPILLGGRWIGSSWAQTATDAELRTFVGSMQNSSYEQQEATLMGIFDAMLLTPADDGAAEPDRR